METVEPPLVLVAHPDDETLTFSAVCPGADVIAVTDGNWRGRGAERREEFARACALLGARRAEMLGIADIYPWPLPHEMLVRQLSPLGPRQRVYTHSPNDEHPHHRSVGLAAACVFGEVRVPARGARPSEIHPLDAQAFRRKSDILNTHYARELRTADDSYGIPPEMVLAVEAFTRISYREFLQGLALNRCELRWELPDLWSFETSPYERERIQATCRLLLAEDDRASVGRILEIGACEGVMTGRLRDAFPHAAITAVEPHPVFADRLRKRFEGDAGVEVKEESVFQVALEADLVVMAEFLYYLPDHVFEILARVKAPRLLTSSCSPFDDRVCSCLASLGWREAASVTLAPCFEPVDGEESPLLCQRAGTNIRLWQRQVPSVSTDSASARSAGATPP